MQRGQDVLFDVNVRKAGAPESRKNLDGVGFSDMLHDTDQHYSEVSIKRPVLLNDLVQINFMSSYKRTSCFY